MRKPSRVSLRLSLLALFSFLPCSCGKDTLSVAEILRDGGTLESPNGRFVLGFFSPKNSTSRYLGIWFSVNSSTVVWVANRRNPVNDASGSLSFNNGGQLVLSDKNQPLWSPEIKVSPNPTARLLDNGNFILQVGNNPSYLWQSFDFPTDTLLPGMKLGPDLINKRDRNLTSWKNESDPSPGEYTYKMDNNGEAGQPYLIRNGSEIIFRSGPWNGIEFSGHHRMRSFQDLTFTVVFNSNESYYEYGVKEDSTLARLVVEPSGYLRRYGWDEETQEWKDRWSAPDDSVCDNYEVCGPNAVCNSGSFDLCRCLEGFEPKSPQDWRRQIWRAGCRRTTSLTCRHDGDGFLRKNRMKLPDTSNATVNRSVSFNGCEESCLRSCSCVAFAPANIEERGSGCIIWNGSLVDIRNYSDGGQDLYLRLEKGDLARFLPKESGRNIPLIIGLTLGATALILLAVVGFVFWKKRKRVENSTPEANEGSKNQMGFIDEENDLPLFGLDTISIATNNFADINKIGRGGFGEVYKGRFQDGQLVAVKRIYSESGEGIAEFMTEVRLIAKLQHRNLVRLLGCCSGGGERLLVYEYMPNGSLDFFIFGDKEKRSLLDWPKRLSIILGIARGLLYLHQDSRLRVIHRDLKAANVLLDEDMNPKISDFGTARIIQREQMMHRTMKIVGTIGYMSPEYVMLGKFSEKSDIFSFGVLLLEIVSGKRNQLNSVKNPCMELLAHAWRLNAENESEKLMDESVSPTNDLSEIKRFIQVGLLCVQEAPEIRPSMQQAVLMLVNKGSVLPTPEKPGFFNPTSLTSAAMNLSDSCSSSTFNANTVTEFEGR